MVYEPTVWKNREVERPRTYQIQDNGDGTVTLIPAEGQIIEPGTPIIADNMNKIEQGIAEADQKAETAIEQMENHINNKNNPHNVTKAQVGLGNVDNIRQMPISGGTFTGIVTAHSNTSYTTRQIRNIILSTGDPNLGAMQDGDIWIKYK